MLLLQYHNKAFNTLELDRAGKSVDQAFHMEKPNNNLRQKMSHYVRKILSFSDFHPNPTSWTAEMNYDFLPGQQAEVLVLDMLGNILKKH